MPKKLLPFLVLLGCLFSTRSQTLFAHSAEVFAKGNVSKSFVSSSGDSWVFTVAGSTGIAFLLFPQVRVEGRFMVRYSEQNKMTDSTNSPLWSDITTQTNIYSAGLDIDILSDKHAIQPFIYIGGGYIESMSNFTYVANGERYTSKKYGPSANGGLGFRVKLGKSVGFEVEAFGYAQDIHKKNPLIDWTGSVGIRFYL